MPARGGQGGQAPHCFSFGGADGVKPPFVGKFELFSHSLPVCTLDGINFVFL